MDSSAPMSPADFAAMSGNGGFNMETIVILLLIFMMGGFGGGYGGGNYANAMQQGFDNQNTLANQREILAATNQSFHDTLGVIQNTYNELQRDIASIAVSQQQAIANQNECCCSTKQLIQQGNAALAAQIAQNEYNNAMRDAATNANFTAQIQGLKDTWYEDKIASLQQQVQGLNTVIGNQGIQSQLDAIQQNMVTYPRGWSYSAGPSPFCGCGSYNI